MPEPKHRSLCRRTAGRESPAPKRTRLGIKKIERASEPFARRLRRAGEVPSLVPR
jgi:hypothetical protein